MELTSIFAKQQYISIPSIVFLTEFLKKFLSFSFLFLNKKTLILNSTASNSNVFSFFFSFLKRTSCFSFSILVDLFAADFLKKGRSRRFSLFYLFLSVFYNERICLQKSIDSFEPYFYTLTGIYLSSGWLEREVYDMFGIFFQGHPDLRRILSDYGFDGYPLRKDFPLNGFTELRYQDFEKKILVEPVQVSQEYRFFEFAMPWSWDQIRKY